MEKACLSPLQIYSLDDVPAGTLHILTAAHMQTHFEIIWIQEGDGYHIVEELRHALSPGHMYFAMPGQHHKLTLEPGCSGYILQFEETMAGQEADEYPAIFGASLKRLFGHFNERKPNGSAAEDLSNLLHLMLKEVKKHGLQRKPIVLKYLTILLMLIREEMISISGFPRQAGPAGVVDRFFTMMEENFRTEKMVGFYAGRLHVSANYLNFLIKAFTGHPAKYHIQQRVIHEAKRMACYRTSSLKEIAYHLGFRDSSHFSKFFKNVSGVNFSSFMQGHAVCAVG